MMNSGLSASDVAVLSGANNRGCNDGFGGDGWGWIWILLIFGIFNGGWGNGFGWGGNGGANGSGFQGWATRADINEGFALNNIQSGITGIQQGICDSTYALTNAINSGFSTAELSRCNQQAALMQQLNNIQFQNQDMDNPASTSDMMNQLMQMSTIQAMATMTDASTMSYAASLVGKTVTIGEFTNGRLNEIVGEVTASATYNGEQVIFVNGTQYPLTSIMAVGELPDVENDTTTPGVGDTSTPDTGETEGTDTETGDGESV